MPEEHVLDLLRRRLLVPIRWFSGPPGAYGEYTHPYGCQ